MKREIELDVDDETIDVELTPPTGLTVLTLILTSPTEREAVKGELGEEYVEWVRLLILSTSNLDEAELEALPGPAVIELMHACAKLFKESVGDVDEGDEDLDLDGGLDLDDWR